jgi:hypothetical protein
MFNTIKNIKNFKEQSYKILTVIIVLIFAYLAVSAPLPFLHNHKHPVVNIQKDNYPVVKKEKQPFKCLLWDFYNNIFNSFFPYEFHLTLGIQKYTVIFEYNDNLNTLKVISGISRAPPLV